MGRGMLMWWPPYRRRALAEADEYLESFGERAYEACRTDGRNAELAGNHKRARFLGAVRWILAKKLKRDMKLDTATSLVERQEPYDHGPGYVAHRPKDSTLH